MNGKIPVRSEVSKEHQWDLSKLYPSDEAWETGYKDFEKKTEKIESFQGTLGNSAADLKACLEYMNDVNKLEERLGYYAFLKNDEDSGDSERQGRYARFVRIATIVGAKSSYITPEIQAIPDKTMSGFLTDPSLKEYEIYLNKLLRFKPHILSKPEEKLLALQAEANETANKAFGALTDVDMDFGTIKTPEGEMPLSQGSFASFLINPDRVLRKQAYTQFYKTFEQNKNTLSTLYNGSVQLDIYQARVRKYPSCRAAALFPDKVPEEVYDNLVGTVNDNLPALHSYYELRKQMLNVDELRHYDVYVPLVKEIQVKHTYEEAVEVIRKALKPLGSEYVETLCSGLLKDRWVDRYENKGKRSGAYSAGSYFGSPNILMNFKESVLRDVFTLAHEGGHSMHSWYSVRNNPFQHYNYTIFEAEVASTFNEQLLAKYMLGQTDDNKMKAYLIGKQVDDIIGTIYRQTMFAEFEHKVHAMAEKGEPLTTDALRSTYRDLMEKYFGSAMVLEENSDLEGLRIPHFYRAFYVYKYSTGLSAAIYLAETVMNGGEIERDRYLNFLKSGGSKYPLESLSLAGVDMSKPEPVEKALKKFSVLVNEMKELME